MNRIIRLAATGLICAAPLGPALADPPGNGGFPSALSLALEAIHQEPKGLDGSPFQPVIVLADKVAGVTAVKVFDTPAAVKSRGQARDGQLAWFVYLSGIDAAPAQLTVTYSTPYNGRFGTVIVRSTEGAWAVSDHQKAHSSSGARFFYGELYEGVTCRSGSEMARRWNMYADAVAAMNAKRPSTPLSELSTTCAGDTFPDVIAYQQAKALGVIK